jgi:transposase
MLGVAIGPANVQDRDAGPALVRAVRKLYHWIELLWVDAAYAGPNFAKAAKLPRLAIEVVRRRDGAKGFVVLPRRWVVERTNGWITRCRRLVRHYEALLATAEAFSKLAMIRIMLRRLARPTET